MCDCFGNASMRRNTSTGKMTRESRWLGRPQTSIPQKLAAIGLNENLQQFAYKGITQPFMPFQIKGEQFVQHPQQGKLFDLRYKFNICYLLVGLFLWAGFGGYVVYEILLSTCSAHGWTTCKVSQHTESSAWVDDAAPLDVFMRTRDPFLTADIRSCKIVSGSFPNYIKHASKNPPEIHPEEGGCEIPPSMLVSGDLVDQPPSDGGCLLYPDDKGYSWCKRLSGAKVLGQYGDPEYSFILVDIKAKVKDLIAAGNNTAISFAVPEIVGGGTTEVWTSMYYTFDSLKPIVKELFFQKVNVQNSDGDAKQFTQYHHEFNRWEYTPPSVGALAEEEVKVATLYLRATTSKLAVEEWYVKTLLGVPQEVGGFFTFTVFFGAFLYFCLHHLCPKRLAGFEEVAIAKGQDTDLEINRGSPKDAPCTGVTLLENNEGNYLKSTHIHTQAASQLEGSKGIWEESTNDSHTDDIQLGLSVETAESRQGSDNRDIYV